MNYEEYILQRLLDKYERSAAYRGKGRLNRGIYFIFDRESLPEYFKDNTAQFKEAVNAAAVNLENRGFITVHWLKHEKGNIISRVSLVAERAGEIYSLLKRRSRRDKEAVVLELAREYMGKSRDWATDFYRSLMPSIENGKDMALYIDINNPGLTENVFKSINAVTELEAEVPVRIFSARALGKSKEFEKIRGRVSRILRDFMKLEDLEREDDILSACGIVSNPSNVFFCGPLEARIGPQPVDFSYFEGGTGLSPQTVDNMEILNMNFSSVITVENLTSYYELVKKYPRDRLAIYTGGYPHMVLIGFMKKIAAEATKGQSGMVFYHWGDIDFGGISILLRLRLLAGTCITPVMMDAESLGKYKDACIPLEPKYRTLLENHLKDPEYSEFSGVMSYMLENNIRLEQENIDAGDVTEWLALDGLRSRQGRVSFSGSRREFSR